MTLNKTFNLRGVSALIILSMALFSQVIEKKVGFNIYPFIASVALCYIVIIFCKIRNKVSVSLCLLFCGISMHLAIASVLYPCEFGAKQIFSLLMVLVLFLAFYNKSVFDSFLSVKLHYFLVFFSILFLIVASFGYSLIDIFSSETRSKVGLYSEYSHLALFVMPSLIYLFLSKKYFESLIGLLFIMWLSFSSTAFMYCLIFIALVVYVKFGFALSFWLLPVVGVAVGSLVFLFGMQDTIARFTGVLSLAEANFRESSLSSIVWLNGWSQSFDYLSHTKGWGVGINRMGCQSFAGFGAFTQDITYYLGMPLNIHDGSILISKIISEFGLFGICLITYILFIVKRFLSSLTLDDIFNNSDAKFGFVCSVSILSLLFVRGLGYFNFPFIMTMCWIFYITGFKKDKL